MTKIHIQVPGVPRPQPRQKYNTQTGRNYAPGKHISTYKATIKVKAQEAMDGPYWRDCGVVMHVVFLFPRPQRMIWKTKPMPREPHTSTPDVDNVLKAVKDALTKIVYHDDAQVYKETGEKYYAAGDEDPHTEITVVKED
jgi:Holliday junction resolvase RusA-like endonuclease